MRVDYREIPLLEGVDADAVARCAAENGLFTRRYPRGATVHRQHDACSMLDVVLSGTLAAYSLSESGSSIAMFEFAKGSIVGANLLFGEVNAYPLNIYCESDCELLHIRRGAVEEFLRHYGFVMGYVRALSANSQGMNRRIVMMTQRTLRENLMEYLRRQSVLQGSETIRLPVTKKELADYLGVQRPSLFRELKKLKDEGRIRIDNRRIRIMA
jgi:CRP-like cAMP-binding protein